MSRPKQYPKYFIDICLYDKICPHKKQDKNTKRQICRKKGVCEKGDYKKIISVWRLEHDGESY